MNDALPITLVSALLLSGCSSLHEAAFNKGHGVEDEVLLVVPLSEPKESLWYGASTNGKTVVQAFKVWARRVARPNFAEGPEVDEILQRVLDWRGKQITRQDWKKLTAGTGIRYVLYGEITDLRMNQPNRIAMVEPSLSASYRVVDARRGKIAFAEDDFRLSYNQGRETQFGGLGFETDRETITRELLTALGKRIGHDLYSFTD